jgi:ankyrin repeat protein
MEAVKLLIEKGADVNAVNQFGFTPLHVAISNRLSGIVRVLLKAGADPLIKTIPGELDGALARDAERRYTSELSGRREKVVL